MDVDVINQLKNKVSNEFYNLLCKIRNGHRINYDFILEEISFIDILDQEENPELYLTILQYYLNNKQPMINKLTFGTINSSIKVENNLNSSSTTSALSAAMGKKLNDEKVSKTTTINGKPLTQNIQITTQDVGFKYYKDKESFNADLQEGVISSDNIVLIEETQELYSNGHYFGKEEYCIFDYDAIYSNTGEKYTGNINSNQKYIKFTESGNSAIIRVISENNNSVRNTTTYTGLIIDSLDELGIQGIIINITIKHAQGNQYSVSKSEFSINGISDDYKQVLDTLSSGYHSYIQGGEYTSYTDESFTAQSRSFIDGSHNGEDDLVIFAATSTQAGLMSASDKNKLDSLNQKLPIINHGQQDTTLTITPNTYHIWGEVSELQITLPASSEINKNNQLDQFTFQFDSGSTPTVLHLASEYTTPLKFIGIRDTDIQANKTYLVSIINYLVKIEEAS